MLKINIRNGVEITLIGFHKHRIRSFIVSQLYALNYRILRSITIQLAAKKKRDHCTYKVQQNQAGKNSPIMLSPSSLDMIPTSVYANFSFLFLLEGTLVKFFTKDHAVVRLSKDSCFHLTNGRQNVMQKNFTSINYLIHNKNYKWLRSHLIIFSFILS